MYVKKDTIERTTKDDPDAELITKNAFKHRKRDRKIIYVKSGTCEITDKNDPDAEAIRTSAWNHRKRDQKTVYVKSETTEITTEDDPEAKPIASGTLSHRIGDRQTVYVKSDTTEITTEDDPDAKPIKKGALRSRMKRRVKEVLAQTSEKWLRDTVSQLQEFVTEEEWMTDTISQLQEFIASVPDSLPEFKLTGNVEIGYTGPDNEFDNLPLGDEEPDREIADSQIANSRRNSLDFSGGIFGSNPPNITPQGLDDDLDPEQDPNNFSRNSNP